MLIFQWIVIPVAIVLSIVEFSRWLSRARRMHLIKALVWFGFAVCVWQPNLIQRIAAFANIGRGADFLLYSLVAFTLLTTFYFLRQLETQRRQMTLLVRELALRTARDPAGDNET
jgi:hypothetical protein